MLLWNIGFCLIYRLCMVCGVLLLIIIIIRIHCFILIIIQIKKGKRKSVLLPHTIIILFVLLCFLYYTSEYLSLNKLYNQRTGETFGYLCSHFRPFFLCIEHHHCSYFICNTHTHGPFWLGHHGQTAVAVSGALLDNGGRKGSGRRHARSEGAGNGNDENLKVR